MSKSPPEEQPFRVYTPESIGQAIRHYRKQAGVTQAQLAHDLGIQPAYLSRLEKGHETEQLRRVLTILKHLGVRATLRHEDW
jgi:HTH-type transcriptional regulator / antitoxin HipB